jgi:excisionase family DNA binding protein
MPELRVLTAEEVASVLRVDLTLVITSIANGELPGNRIGRHWRIDQGALMQWLQGSYQAPLRKDLSR